MTKFTSTFAVVGLLSACGPADGVVFFQVQTDGNTDTIVVDVRDLRSIDLGSFLDQRGLPVASEGDCDVFNIGGAEFLAPAVPGSSFNIGVVSMTGASGEPVINFNFDPDTQTYEPDVANADLFVVGDEIELTGNDSDITNGFDRSIDFPQETILTASDTVTRGTDFLVSWNPSDVGAEQVLVALSATDVVFQNPRTIICAFRDVGAGTIPGVLTTLLPTGGFLNSVAVARINGDNFVADPNGVIEKLERGKSFIFSAVSTDAQGVSVVD